jgi:chromosome segregation ATPase
MAVVGLAILVGAGCVSSGTYEAVKSKREAETAQRELHQQRLKVQTIEKMHAERKKEMDEWVGKLGAAVEKLDGMTKNWSEVQEELTRLRIAREPERQRERDKEGKIGIVVENEPATPQPSADPSARFRTGSGESREQARDRLRQLQQFLEQHGAVHGSRRLIASGRLRTDSCPAGRPDYDVSTHDRTQLSHPAHSRH